MSSLIEQVMFAILKQIDTQQLPIGAKLPSIRQAAKLYSASTFTIAEAYSRLTTQGHIESHPGRGYFVLPPKQIAKISPHIRQPLNQDWLLQGIYQSDEHVLQAGCGWLPSDWYDPELSSAALRQLARSDFNLHQYGQPQGLLVLRQLLAQKWAPHHLHVSAQQILLTQGASQALAIVIDTYCQAGDTVLVDEPGYTNLLNLLRSKQLQMIAVPWQETGPDVAKLADILQHHHPKLMFTNPILQNPTGVSYQLTIAHHVLQLLAQHQCLLVENQVSYWLSSNPPPPLSALDNMNNSILISSFTKHLSPALRVGYVATSESRLGNLMQQKMLSGLTTSAINEHLAWLMWQDPRSERQLLNWRRKLEQAQNQTQALLQQQGWHIFAHPSSGLFVFARHPNIEDAYQFALTHHQDNITLAPGGLFTVMQTPNNPWFRFNVAFCQQTAFSHWLLNLHIN